MKAILKSILMAAVCFSATQVSQAQSAYLTLDAGYAIPTTGYQGSGTYTEYDDHSVETVNRKGVNRGFNFGVHGGYMFTENLGVDLGINYLLGTKTEPYKMIDKTTGGGNDFTAEMRATSLRITPAIRFAVPLNKATVYSRIGMGIYALNRANTYMKIGYTVMGSNFNIEEEQQVKGGISFGLNGAIGATYKLKKYSIFGEVCFYQQTFINKSSEVTSYKENGSDAMSTLTESDKKTVYVKSLDDYGTSNDNEPSKALMESMPFSNLSINVGIQIPF